VDFPQANRLTIHILAAVAEHEAAMISARTKSALAAARARGIVLGGDRGNIASQASKGALASAATRGALSSKRAADLLPAIQYAQTHGAKTLRDIAAALNETGIPAARGGQWSETHVKRILDRRFVRVAN
jgi:DNA invertase Pin-like site-specific DNA recombinase